MVEPVPALAEPFPADDELPGVDWSDEQKGFFETEDFSIEFSIPEERPITCIMLAVRGGGDAFGALKALALPNKWSLFDCSESDFLDLNRPTADSFEAFQNFRDRALKQTSRRTPPKKQKPKQPTAKKKAVRPKAKRKRT